MPRGTQAREQGLAKPPGRAGYKHHRLVRVRRVRNGVRRHGKPLASVLVPCLHVSPAAFRVGDLDRDAAGVAPLSDQRSLHPQTCWRQDWLQELEPHAM